jgi:hypothetical protein
LKSEYYFDCNCARCSDPTESQTYVSALSCEVCETGFLLPERPLEYYSQWRCNARDCEFVLGVEDVERKIDRYISTYRHFPEGGGEGVSPGISKGGKTPNL